MGLQSEFLAILQTLKWRPLGEEGERPSESCAGARLLSRGQQRRERNIAGVKRLSLTREQNWRKRQRSTPTHPTQGFKSLIIKNLHQRPGSGGIGL